MRKLLNKRGETITEVLVGILIIALSSALLMSMITAAVRVNQRTNDATEEIYGELSAAELKEDYDSGTVTIIATDENDVVTKSMILSVDYYGENTGTLTAYGQ